MSSSDTLIRLTLRVDLDPRGHIYCRSPNPISIPRNPTIVGYAAVRKCQKLFRSQQWIAGTPRITREAEVTFRVA